MKIASFLLFFSVLMPFLSWASEDSNFAHRISLPVFETPDNENFSLENPSMSQSLDISQSFYQFSHYSLQKFWGDRSTGALISIIVFDTLATWLPLSNAWLHEEWHRAVLNQYRIDSYNGVYDLEFFSETISVYDIKDEELENLKANHPQDIIRLHSAGLEAQSQLNLNLEKDKFFNQSKSFDYMLIWFNTINSLAYMNTCSTSDANELTRTILNRENSDISKRDFTGLDCNAWVYDLFRPQENYADRGIHPSGTGIKRYIDYDDLSIRERGFLRTQYYLYFLNFIDPFLLSKDFFRLPEKYGSSEITYNTNVQHYLNPFGYTINWNVFLNTNSHKFFLQWKNHANYKRYFPGLSASFIDKPLQSNKFQLSSTLTLWQQPKDLNFFTRQHEYGGYISTRLNWLVSKYVTVFGKVGYKTQGWLEGHVALDEQISFQAGVMVNRFE